MPSNEATEFNIQDYGETFQKVAFIRISTISFISQNYYYEK